MSNIDDSSKIPIFAVVSTIPVFAGFIFWLSTIHSDISQASKINISQDAKIEQTKDLLLDIRDRVIRIEERINEIKKGSK